MLQLKRAYERPAAADGQRILVERLWPRGLTKARASIDLWLKEVAPSAELRKWFDHDPAKWKAFQQRYWKELDKQPHAVKLLQDKARRGRVSLIYAAHDERHNGALALKAYLDRQTVARVRPRARARARAKPRRAKMSEANERLREHPEQRFHLPQIAIDLEESVGKLQREAVSENRNHRQETLYRRGPLTVALFLFAAGASLPQHVAEGVVTVQVLRGRLKISAEGQVHDMPAGALLILSPGVRHGVEALEASRMLLTVCLNAAP